jgi:protein ImuA
MNLPERGILAQLQKDILSLQGYHQLPTENDIPIGFRPIENAFPLARFPVGCMHEFINLSVEDASATAGFIAALLHKRMQMGGACLWISAARTLFPAALSHYGIEPHQVIFVDVKSEKEVLYATEEALKCNCLTAVMSEIKELSFKQSRRFQLAAEKSRVVGFILRTQPRTLATTACVSRWQITAMPSELSDGMPGVGFPRWQVELLKVRNGKAGKWAVEWTVNGFKEVSDSSISHSHQEQQRKLG